MNSVVSALQPATLHSRPTTTNISGFWSILARRLPSIAAITLGSLALSMLYLAVTPQTYLASTTLFIDPRPKKIVSEDTGQSGLGTDLALLESQVAIIRSDAVLSRVVMAMNLAEDPEFAPPPSRGIGAQIKAMLGMKQPISDSHSQALASLAQRVTVKRAQKTYVVEIEASSSAPVKAARITQAIVDAYLADQTSAKTDEAQRANNLIDSRLGELREQVRRAETRVDEFRKSNSILTSEGGTVGEQQLTKLNLEYINSRTQAAEAKARLDEVTRAARSGNPDAITDPAKTGLVQRFREQLALVSRREASLASQLLPRHPVLIDIRSQMTDIKAQIAAELQRLAASSKADFQVAGSRERELSKVLEQAKLEVGRTNTAQIKLRELEQEVAASRELMRLFLARSKETDEQQKISAPDARMISPPSVPSRASKPVPALILALGLLGGLAAGVARALMLDHLDQTLKSPAEIATRTGLLTLAAIPTFTNRTNGVVPIRGKGAPTKIETSTFGDLARAVSHPSGASEIGFRRSLIGVLNRLRSNALGQTPHVVLVVGPNAGSGSSSTAFAIAYAAACQGDRVLLIDAASADTTLSDALVPEIPNHGTIALDNEDDLASITSRDPRSGLVFLPIALADLRVLKTAQRSRLQKGLHNLAQGFDFVIIDGGAVMEDDSFNVMLPLANEVILAARSGRTSAQSLTAASHQFDRVKERVSGVILTRSETT